MRHLLGIALMTTLLAAGATSAPAHAGGRVHFGIGIGFPIYPAPWYYPPPAYYYPPPVYVQPAPVYVEPPQAAPPPPQAQAAPPPEQYWYYCAESKTYYPYVQSCAGPWQRVRPQPQG